MNEQRQLEKGRDLIAKLLEKEGYTVQKGQRGHLVRAKKGRTEFAVWVDKFDGYFVRRKFNKEAKK